MILWFSQISKLKNWSYLCDFQTEDTADVVLDKLIMYARGSAIVSTQSLSRPDWKLVNTGSFMPL